MLHIDAISVRYRTGSSVLDAVSLNVDDGEFVTVLGSNGAGKTTLLRAITGTLPLYGGSILGGQIVWQGKAITKVRAQVRMKQGIVMSPEGRGIFGNLTVDENLRVGGFTLSSRERNTRVAEALEIFPDLTERKQMLAGLLSGGQQQMLAIARALIVQPKLLLLDEPSLGLAPLTVARVAEVISRIHGEGTAVLLVEQNAGVALELSERGYVLDLGRVSMSGASADLLRSDEIRDTYLGGGGDVTVQASSKGSTK